MSATNVELLAQAFAGWGKGDPANMSDALHPDCELVVPDSVPYGGYLSGGRGGDRLVHARAVAVVRGVQLGARGFHRRRRSVVVPVRVKARAKNGRTMDVHNLWIYEFIEGKLVRGRVYADTAVLRDTVEGVIPS